MVGCDLVAGDVGSGGNGDGDDERFEGGADEGTLVEQEIYGWMEQIQTLYLKLLREVSSLRASRGVDLVWATETPSPRDFEIERLS
ncbi:uncharacterized protein A4U43_C04F30600 [Asparagus officinalis]|uniref:Uncharacterized protein n=1 Tax=Asparagus officinalis TaxID=4686 RepID=A0A5P1F9D6_ASPOF|nr:uncharacterized protein A4U43_C04F30600 [Asparagus officinalis]